MQETCLCFLSRLTDIRELSICEYESQIYSGIVQSLDEFSHAQLSTVMQGTQSLRILMIAECASLKESFSVKLQSLVPHCS